MFVKEKTVAKYGRGAITASVLVCFIVSTALIETGAATKIPGQPQQMASTSKERKTTLERSILSASAHSGIGRDIMWREPVDIKGRDLFFGIGGRKGAPDPSVPFTFVKHSQSGTQKKVIV